MSNTTQEQIPSDAAGQVADTSFKSRWLAQLASSRFRRLSREFIWIGLGQAAAVVGALVGIRILTGILPPEVYGQLALGMTAAALVNQTVLGPLANAATRFFAPAQEAGTLRSYFTAVRSLLFRATGGILLVALLLSLGLAAAGQSAWIGLSLAAVCFALLSGCNSVLNGMQNAARQRAVVALHQGLASWGRFLLAAGMVLWLGATSTMAMLGYALAILIVLASQGWFFRRTVHLSAVEANADEEGMRRWNGRMFSYAWPFATFGVFTWAQMASDRWALEVFATTREVGLYTVLYQLGYYPITILTGLIVQLVSPVFFQRAGDGLDGSRVSGVQRLNRRLTMGVLFLTGFAVLLAFGLHGFVFRWLVAPEYHPVSWLLPGMVLAGGLFATGQFASLSLMSENKSMNLIGPKVVTAVAGVGLNLIGARVYGVQGVVAANIFFSGFYCLWMHFLLRCRQEAHCNM